MNEVVKFPIDTPVEVTLRFEAGKHVEGRYGDQVMYSLSDDRVMYVPPYVEQRFQELAIGAGEPALPGIAPNILSDRLKRLERERVLLSRPYSERPVRLTYELTAEGRELAGALRLLADWGARADSSDALRHRTCGTPLEARWYCPTCARAIAEDEATELRRL